MKIDTEKIFKYKDKGCLNAFITGLQIKTLFRNSTIYNYKDSKLHQQLHLPKKTFFRHLDILIENGDAEEKGNNIIINRLSDSNRFNKNPFIRTTKNKVRWRTRKEIDYYIHILLFKMKYDQQQLIIDKKILSNQHEKVSSGEELNACKRAFKFVTNGGDASVSWRLFEVDETIKFTINTLKEYLGVSQEKLYSILRWFKKKGMIEIKRNIKYLGNIGTTCKPNSPALNVVVDRYGNIFSISSNIYIISSIY